MKLIFIILLISIIKVKCNLLKNKLGIKSGEYVSLDAYLKYQKTSNTIKNSHLNNKSQKVLVNNNVNKNYLPNILYWNGYIKYFKFNNVNTKINSFFVNNYYNNNTLDISDIDLKYKINNLNEYNLKYYFYAELYSNKLVIYNNKKDISKVSDVIDFSRLLLNKTNINGILINYGTMNEGSCFKLISNENNENVSYMICMEDINQEVGLFDALFKSISNYQLNSSTTSRENIANYTLTNSKNFDSLTSKDFNKSYNDNKDGYWKVLNDWTLCSLPCGGGLTYLNRVCILPNGFGKNCVGEATLVKHCNTQKCTTNKYNNKNNLIIEELKPTLKVMPFSNRPQRYEVSYKYNYN